MLVELIVGSVIGKAVSEGYDKITAHLKDGALPQNLIIGRVTVRRLLLLTSAILLNGCAVLAPPDDWSENDTKYEMMWQVLNVIDSRQTGRITQTYNVYESNWMTRPLIGPRPSARDAYQIGAAYALSHYLMTKYMPAKLRPYWHGSMIPAKYLVIQRNHELGLGY